jgi:CheY-like chemotaxis protein
MFADSRRSQSDQSQVAQPATNPVPNRSLLFLLVDDDPLILLSLSELIQEMGHQSINADDAVSALAHLGEGNPIDVLLTDVKLPKMDGWELAGRARPIKPHLPIIFTTGYDIRKVKDVSKDPFMRYLQKPFGQKELDDVLLSMGLIEVGRV